MFDLEAARKAGASDSQIADFLASKRGFDLEAARKAGASDSHIADFLSSVSQDSAQPKPEMQPTPAEQGTTAEGVSGAVVRGAAPIAAGAALGAALGAPFGGVGAIPGAIGGAGVAAITPMVADPIVAAANKAFGTNYQMPSQALEDLMTRMGVPVPKTAVERTIQSGVSGIAGAGGTVALGKTLAKSAGPVIRGVGESLAAQPIQQLAGGAGAGIAGQLARESDLGAPAEIAATLAGGVAGAKLAGMRTIPNPGAQTPIVQEAEKQGVRVLTSDVRQPETFIGKTARALGERIPFAGTSGVRQAQQQERIAAVKSVLDDFGATNASNASDDVARDFIAKRSSDLNKYVALKGDVISRLSASGAVPVPKVLAAIDDQLAILAKNKDNESVARIIDDITKFRETIQGKNLSAIELERKLLGEKYNDPGLASIKSVAEGFTNKLYGPLREDMGNFIKNAGERRDYNKWYVANRQLSRMSDDLDNTAVRTTLDKGEATPEVVQRMLFSKKPSEQKALYRGLSQQGRANARMAILFKASDAASYDLPTGQRVVDPDRFRTQVKNLSSTTGVFFRGEDLEKVEGLMRTLSLTRRASEAAVNTNTGQQAVPFIAGSFLTDLFGSAGAATAGAAGIGLTARAYESAPVRNLLMKIPSTIKGSKEEAALVKRLMSVLQQQNTGQSNK